MNCSKRWNIQAVMSLLILGVLAAVAIPSYLQSMVRPKVRFVFSSLNEFQYEQQQARQRDTNHVLPKILPIAVAYPDRAEGTTYADPFDTKEQSGVTQLYCVTKARYGNGEPVDFSFRGNPFKWIRFSETEGIMYSFGPDQDDDLGVHLNRLLESLSTPTVVNDLSALTYDSTNGTVSNGDCWRLIALYGAF